MRVVKIKEFIKENQTVEWLIEGILPDTGWTLFYGLPGVGKTTFAAQLCASLEQGYPFLGRETKKTRILFVQADSLPLEWKAMLERICPESLGLTVVEVDEKCLGNAKAVEWLHNAVSVIKPEYIVYDSLQRLTAWTLNTDIGVANVLNTFKLISMEIPYMIIHHPTHSDFRASGHNSLSANASNVWGLLKTKLRIDKGRLVKIKELSLTRDEDGLWIPKSEYAANAGRSDDLDDDIMNRPLL